MKYYVLLALAIAFMACNSSSSQLSQPAQPVVPQKMAPKDNTVSKEAYDRASKMLATYKMIYNSGVRPSFLPDDQFYYGTTTREGRKIYLVDAKTGTKQEITAQDERIVKNRKPRASSRLAILSPDGSKEAFIKDWNLWLRDTNTKKEWALTTDGIQDYGYATDNAGWKHSDRAILLWSPDSKKIATFKQDQRHVADMHLVRTKVGAPELHSWKYPLPGDERVIEIERVIIDVDGARVIPLELDRESRRGTVCDDISCTGKFDDNEWSADSKQLAFVGTTRDHKTGVLMIANAATGKVRTVYEEVEETQYESGRDVSNWRFLPESNEFLWYSQRDDWGHLYLGDLSTGKIKHQITKGDYVVARVKYVDRQGRKIYFEGVGREAGVDPYHVQLYSVDFSGKNLKRLTPENADHRTYLSPDASYFIDTYSDVANPPISVLRKISGEKIEVLSKADIQDLKAFGWKPPISFSVTSDNGQWDLYGLMYLPTNFDPTKKYPVINYLYPGPQGGSVGRKSFSPSSRGNQAMAELGFVVISLEGSCNPWRSKSFHDACYGNMGINTLPDQISGIRQLAKKYPYIDVDRVGIWGRSGGGFASTAAILKFPDFYKVAVSIAGNHDNRNYEDDWGERYIGLLKGDNYADQANQRYADQLKGKLFIIHGMMDDNVPPQNSLLMVDALMKANKDFDLLLVPYGRHGFGKDQPYVTRRRWDYFVRNLMGKEPPKNYQIKY